MSISIKMVLLDGMVVALIGMRSETQVDHVYLFICLVFLLINL